MKTLIKLFALLLIVNLAFAKEDHFSESVNNKHANIFAGVIPDNIYSIKTQKTFFHNAPNANTRRKGYVVKNDIVTVTKIQGNYAHAIFETEMGTQVKGWLLLRDLNKVVLSNSIDRTNYRNYLGNWETGKDIAQQGFSISYNSYEKDFDIYMEWSAEFYEELRAGNHFNIIKNCVNYEGILKNRSLRAWHRGLSSCDDTPEFILINSNQMLINFGHNTLVLYNKVR